MAEPIVEYDLIIVGAGIAGSAAARAFGRDGRRVLLLERDLATPDRIVGELMQPGGINALKALQLQDCLQDIDGIPCYGYGVVQSDDIVQIPYPNEESTGKQAQGMSFHHGRFVDNLRTAARTTENVTLIEATVTSLLQEQEQDKVKVIGVTARDKQQGETKNYYAPLTIVADGLFSKFRKQVTTKQPDVRSHFVGYILRDAELPFPQHGHVFLCKPSPVLMYQIGTHETRVLVDVPGKLPSALSGELQQYMKTVVAPQLSDNIQTKFLEAVESDQPRSMPNGFLPPSLNECEGMILIGDAMNIRHPLTGGGMTVALNDVVLLRELLAADKMPSFTDASAVLQALGSFHWKRKRYCTSINVLAMALYRLFAAENDANLSVLQRGCFGYFKLGGECVNGPVGLLSGLNQRPIVLVYHFFSVAFYAIYLEFKRGGWAGALQNLVMPFTVLYASCVTILPYLWSETRR